MNICMTAGEASGDLSGSLLALELRRRMPDVVIWGIGGRRMREAGVELIEDASRWSSIGIAEGLKVVPRLTVTLLRLLRAMKSRQPDLYIPIDFGAFNLQAAIPARRNGIKVLYFFPPGSWRRDGSINPKLPMAADLVATPFPWSAEALNKAGVKTVYVGHPLLDVVQPETTSEEFREAFGLMDCDPVIGLLPGSRRQEISHILGPQLRAAKLIAEKMPRVGFVIPVALSVDRREIEARIASLIPDIKTVVVEGQTYEAMNAADFLVCTSGTVTLEAAILAKPMVIVYRGSRATKLEYRLRRLAIPVIGLPNIVAGKLVAPELVQAHCNAQEIAKTTLDIVGSPERMASMSAELRKVRDFLGEPGAISRVADLVMEALGVEDKAETR